MTAHADSPAHAPRIRAVFFDLDDTVCDDASVWVHCARRAAEQARRSTPQIDVGALSESFLDISRRYWSSSECTVEIRPLREVRAEQWRQALSSICAAAQAGEAQMLADEYARLRISEISVFPDAIATLEALRRRGLKLALITNGFRSTHIEKIARLGLDRHFDHVLIAEIEGWFKPDERIFRKALALCDCDAAEAVMVGDDLDNDIAGAEAVGIRSCWFNPDQKPLPASAVQPSAGEITVLGELCALINSTT